MLRRILGGRGDSDDIEDEIVKIHYNHKTEEMTLYRDVGGERPVWEEMDSLLLENLDMIGVTAVRTYRNYTMFEFDHPIEVRREKSRAIVSVSW